MHSGVVNVDFYTDVNYTEVRNGQTELPQGSLIVCGYYWGREGMGGHVIAFSSWRLGLCKLQ